MLTFLPRPIVGIIASILYFVCVMFLAATFFVIFFIWIITPIPSWRKRLRKTMNNMPSAWSESIRFTMWLTTKTTWKITGLENLDKETSYLLISNHQSWLDILSIQRIFDRHIPQLRYFMKSQLIWIPIVGQACWVLGYPFMKRYTAAYLKKHPEDQGKDLETTKKACQRFRAEPITLINYVEGTRFRSEKHRKQKSPYQHLLKPKAGGVAFILSAMQGHINTILNVTIVYSGHNIIWPFLQGKTRKIEVRIEKIPVTPDLIGDYQNDPAFREHFQEWLNTVWKKKDQQITEIKAELAKHK
jgi:1-acyl-sn-glycerol-3-phosphate acyltransferase